MEEQKTGITAPNAGTSPDSSVNKETIHTEGNVKPKTEEKATPDAGPGTGKIDGMLQKAIKKLNGISSKVRNAPMLFKKRIYLLLFVIIFCVVLTVITLLLSLLPSLSYMRAVSIIAVFAALYMGMALPRWVRVVDEHIEFVGKVKEVRQSKIREDAKKAILNSNNRSMLIVTVAVKDKEYNIEVPQTIFSPIVDGATYRFYYATDDKNRPGCMMTNFLFKERITGFSADGIAPAVQIASDMKAMNEKSANAASSGPVSSDTASTVSASGSASSSAAVSSSTDKTNAADGKGNSTTDKTSAAAKADTSGLSDADIEIGDIDDFMPDAPPKPERDAKDRIIKRYSRQKSEEKTQSNILDFASLKQTMSESENSKK